MWETKYQDGKLLIVVSNSKNMESNPALLRLRKIRGNMAGGIRSVRRVAEQYGGNLLLEDEGGTFKAALTPYQCRALRVKLATCYR